MVVVQSFVHVNKFPSISHRISSGFGWQTANAGPLKTTFPQTPSLIDSITQTHRTLLTPAKEFRKRHAPRDDMLTGQRLKVEALVVRTNDREALVFINLQ